MKKSIYLIIKVGILITSIFFIYYKLSDFEELWTELSSFNFTFLSVLILLITLFLTILNWLLESIKWKFLIEKLQLITVVTSYKAILSGITFALLTPNRTGEFAGRIIFLKSENRIKGSFATFVGSIAQVVITILNGIIGVSVIFKFQNLTLFEKLKSPIFYSVIIIFFFVTLYTYFKIGKISIILSKIRFLKKYSHFYSICNDFKSSELFKLLILSALRYIVFLIQFYLLFHFFNVNLNLFETYIIVASTYFIMFLIPSFTLAEIGIRGSIIIFFGTFFSTQLAGILCASTLLWIFNIAIPAFIGSLTLLNKNTA